MSIRLLVLSPFAPRIDAPHGGRVTASLLRRLAERHDVALVCFRGEDEPPSDDALHARCALLEEVVVTRPAPGIWARRARQLAKPLWGHPSIVARAAAPGYEERVRSVAESWRPDVVQIELVETARYLEALDGCPAPRILVDHEPGASAAEDWSTTAAGALRLWRRLDAIAWRRFARTALDRIDYTVVFTDRDRADLQRLAPGVPVRTIPFSVELPERPLDPRGYGPPTLLFFGGYEHPPNADAAVRLLRSIFPAVRERHPDVILELVGDGPTAEMKALAGDGVFVTGPVDALTPSLDRAAMVVAPLRLGGGMRVKALETLAAGKALVASPRALEGLPLTDAENVLIADSDDEFCVAIDDLLANAGRRHLLATNARRWAESALGWDGIIAAYEELYRELVADRE
jgi:glycosyltransferase involved in cell wall biosynthesis